MAISFSGIVGNLQSLGFYDFVLPWLLIFAIVLGVLKKTGILGEGNVNPIVAAVVAFFVAAFTPIGTSLPAYFSGLFGVGGVIIGAFLVLIILSGILGYSPKKLMSDDAEGKTINKTAAALLGLVLIVFAIIAFSAGSGTGIVIPGIDRQTLTILGIIIFVILVVLYSEGGKK